MSEKKPKRPSLAAVAAVGATVSPGMTTPLTKTGCADARGAKARRAVARLMKSETRRIRWLPGEGRAAVAAGVGTLPQRRNRRVTNGGWPGDHPGLFDPRLFRYIHLAPMHHLLRGQDGDRRVDVRLRPCGASLRLR